MAYAERTTVTVERSQAEIMGLLRRFGADEFQTTIGRSAAGDVGRIAFRLQGRVVCINLPLPFRDAPRFTKTPKGRNRRSQDQIEQQYDQEVRRRWRSLGAVIKAKLVAVEDGISTVEREFLADVVLPGQQTIIEWLAPKLTDLYETERLPELPAAR